MGFSVIDKFGQQKQTIAPLNLSGTDVTGVLPASKIDVGGGTGLLVETGTRTYTVRTLTAGSAKLTVTNGSGLAGNPTVDFGSVSATNLSDYVTGTWTPADGSGAGLSFTVANANYLKIGKLVVISANITFPTTASGLTVVISGLPFSVNGTSVGIGSMISNSNQAGLVPAAYNGGSTVIFQNTATGGQPTNANFSTANIIFQVTYVAA